ncbi:MAG: hypothetical protein AMXMBFR83_18310 [Phycisphaerae bacterium]
MGCCTFALLRPVAGVHAKLYTPEPPETVAGNRMLKPVWTVRSAPALTVNSDGVTGGQLWPSRRGIAKAVKADHRPKKGDLWAIVIGCPLQTCAKRASYQQTGRPIEKPRTLGFTRAAGAASGTGRPAR